jgi:hypothetical protein
MEWSDQFPGLNALVSNPNKCICTVEKDQYGNFDVRFNGTRVASIKPSATGGPSFELQTVADPAQRTNTGLTFSGVYMRVLVNDSPIN